MTRTAVALASLLSLVGCGDVDEAPPAPPPDTTAGVLPTSPPPSIVRPEERSCAVDSDCVLVDDGCCPCVHLGAQIAINVAAVDDVAARLVPVCEDVACFTVRSSDPTCCAEAACVDGVCEAWGYDDRSLLLQCESIHAPREEDR